MNDDGSDNKPYTKAQKIGWFTLWTLALAYGTISPYFTG